MQASGGGTGSRGPFDADLIVAIRSVNEFAPKFNTSRTQSSVAEDAAVGTTLVTLDDKASDEDAGERVTQFSLPADSSLFDTADVERGVITV